MLWRDAVPSVRQGGITGGERPLLELRFRGAIPTTQNEPGSSPGMYVGHDPPSLLPL